MQEDERSNEVIDRHPLVTLGALTVGTQIGSALINKMAKHPVALFAMGLGVGIYSYKNRKILLNEVAELGRQGKKVLSISSEGE
ncbi:MAG: hypothetical protein KAG19_02650 [Methylococcales bacterium]|nr:hypothetical protein [Methylococcales bacterium]